MAISNAEAQAAYQRARDALDAISRSPRASKAQKTSVRSERETLDLDFIGKNIAEINERTVHFRRFVARMESLMKSLTTADALLRGMKGLTDVVNDANDVLDK